MKEQSEFGTALKNNDINKLSLILQKHPEFANPGVNPDSSDRTTPLHDAVLYGHIEAAELLIRHGADIEAENQNSKTALDLAKELKNKKMVEFLKQKGAKEKGRADQ
jgi:ankyrin repeat protein